MTDPDRGGAPAILFFPFPAHGHVNPLLPVISELIDAGASVEAMVSGTFAAALRSAGATVWPAAFEALVNVPERPGMAWLARHVRELLRRRRWGFELARHWHRPVVPDLVVVDPMATWGRTWARRHGRRWVLLHTTRPRRPGRAPGLIAVLPEMRSGARRLRPNQACTGPLLRRPSRDPDLPWHRIVAGPTLLVSPGTVFARDARFFAAIAAAFAGSEWLVVMSMGRTDVGDAMSLPANVIARPHLPQLALLEHATAFVTHAGMNSVQEALAYGVPMVLTPRSREQRQTALRLAALGAGVYLRDRTPRPADLRAAVIRVSTDPVMRANLAVLRERIAAMPSAALAAMILLRFADVRDRERR